MPAAPPPAPSSALPPLPSGLPLDDTTTSTHMAAWNAATTVQPSTNVNGAIIGNPKVSLEPPPRFASPVKQQTLGNTAAVPQAPLMGEHPPPEGFVLTGTIDLFGMPALKADFYSYHGAIPPDLILPAGQSPIYQLATLDEDVRMSTFLPRLANTTFDTIALKNPTFTYQNCTVDPTKAAGFHFDCDIVFDESYGKVHQVLTTVLGIKEPTLHLHCGMGKIQAWNSPLSLRSFTLDGVFAGISINPCNGLTMTSIGVELFGFHATKYAPDGSLTSSMDYGFGIFGTMHVDVPGSVTPIELGFEIRESGGDVSLSADMKTDWTDALGIKNLTIKEVNFSTFLSVKSPMSSFSFNVEAVLEADNTIAALMGSYSAGGNFSLSAEFEHLSWTGIGDIFNHLYGGRLNVADLDITIGSASLTVASGAGISIIINDLEVDKYAAVNGAVQFSEKGATVRAGIASNTIQFGDFHLNKAYVQISFARSESDDYTDVIFGGEIQWENFVFDAGVHLYNTPGKEGVEYTIYAQFAAVAAGGGIPFSTLIPVLKGSFLDDITLEGAALIVASQDDPEFGNFNTVGYPVHQGVQVCAVLGEVKAFSDLMRNPSPPRLTLSAGWSQASGFTLDILLPTPVNVNLGRGITTDPFTLQIRTEPPAIRLIAGVKIPVPNEPAPLHFSMFLDFNALGGAATGQLSGSWNNPFGISPKLTIGPNVALSIQIIFEEFLSTGIPSAFGFVGGLQIGKVNAQVAFQVSEVPTQEVLYAEVQNVDINDVVSLASDITQLDFPQPPNFLSFSDLKLYVCPAGTTIGTIVYPRGFSFIASMVIFGKHADASVIISGSSVSVKGGLDNLTLGPLTVRGTSGPRATASLDISPTKQDGSFDGIITLYDSEISLHLVFEVMPKPTFSFSFILKFTERMTFDVEAHLLGEVSNIHDISNLDFSLVATFHQDILDYIAQQINEQFKTASKAEKGEIDSDKGKVADAKRSLDDSIAKAKQALDAATASWKNKSDSVHKSFEDVMNEYNGKVKELQGVFDAATVKYKQDLANAQTQVSHANADRASKLAAAQQQVQKAQAEWAGKINDAQHNLDSANQKMNADFGNAENKIRDAQNNVNSLNNQINDINNKINDFEHANRFDIPKKVALPGLYAGRAVLQASQKVASGVLDAANAILRSQNYLAEQTAMKAANATLAAAKQSGATAITGAQQTLALTDHVTAGVVAAAQSTLSQVQKAGPIAVQAASKAIDDFKNARAAIIKAAQTAVDALVKSGEYLAFQAASNAFAIAQASTHSLELSTAALEAADKIAGGLLDVADWIAMHVVTLVDIKDVTLSGQFGHIAGGESLGAKVKGSIAGKDFSIDEKFDPRHATDFINSLFQQLWKDVRDGLYKLGK